MQPGDHEYEPPKIEQPAIKTDRAWLERSLWWLERYGVTPDKLLMLPAQWVADVELLGAMDHQTAYEYWRWKNKQPNAPE